jgi:hypothetical protein
VDGVPLCSVTGSQQAPVLVSDGRGGAIAVWEDERITGEIDPYAQRSTSTGIYGGVRRHLRTLDHGLLPAGSRAFTRDGTDRDGQPAEGGLYLVTLDAFGLRRSSILAVIR